MNKVNKKILIVDDSPVSQKITERILKKDGYDVLAAWGAVECLKVLESEKPDLILMDVILNDGNGKEVAVRIKENPLTQNIPIVFTTNTLPLKEDKGNQAFDIKGQTYRAFAKPLHPQKILSVIRKEINRSIYGGDLPKDIEIA